MGNNNYTAKTDKFHLISDLSCVEKLYALLQHQIHFSIAKKKRLPIPEFSGYYCPW